MCLSILEFLPLLSEKLVCEVISYHETRTIDAIKDRPHAKYAATICLKVG